MRKQTVCLALALVLLASSLPAAAATPTTGVWIFPTAYRDEAVADELDAAFYIADNASEWIADSFFADSGADSASVEADLYNPTATDLTNVQVFAAVSDDDLFTDISFSGGDSGDVTVVAADLSGGTPFLSDGSSMPAHDVYPAFFTSYGVGDLDAGSDGIRTITIDVTGDFAGGLIVHLDYSAEDASGTVYTGPFEADMNILENGEPAECEEADLDLSLAAAEPSPAPGSAFAFSISWEHLAGADATDGLLSVMIPNGATTGEVSVQIGQSVSSQNPTFEVSTGTTGSGGTGGANVSGNLSGLLVDGDLVEITAELAWESCGGLEGGASATLTLEITGEASGDVKPSGYWKQEYKRASTGNGPTDFSADDLDLFLQRVASHSGVFAYGPWEGTDPFGADDEGWVGIGSLEDALDVLGAHGKENKMSNKAERELLALWLNVASGALNLDTDLEAAAGEDEDDADDDDVPAWDSAAYDTVDEIVAFASDQLADWADGVGASADDLRLAWKLCKAVNQGSLVPA